MKKVVVSLCVTFLSFVAFGQSNQVTKKNIEPAAGMSNKARNFSSFVAPPKKMVTEELSQRTSSIAKNHPEYGIIPYNAQCEDCFEVIEKRTAKTRHYLKNGTNGTYFYNQAGANDINYKDAAGNWRAIDYRLFPSETPNVFVAANQVSPTKIDLNKKEVSVSNGNDALSFNRNLKLYYQTDEETKLVATADWSQTSVGNDGAYVKNIFPGIDLSVYMINGGMKSSFIINNLLSYNDGYLLIEDEMKLPAGTSLSTKMTTKKNNGYEGMITVEELASGKRLYEIGEVVGFDNGDRSINPAQKFSYRVNGNNLSIVVPVKWMNTPGFTFPLTIDPLVTSTNTLLQGSIAGSGGNGSGTFNAATACPYGLTVPTPANATITDIIWACDYVAQNGAVRSEGAFDFLYNACRSPSAVGFYWFCNVATAGVCTAGAGLSSFTDFQTCIPAPQCAPYNMNFTMRFYDRFGAACSNVFIAVNSNWVMTVQGHTVEFTNTVTPFTLSASTICFGQNISALTGTQYGVPAHSINWSFNASGIPSVGSGTNPTISFPAPGPYTVYCIVTDGCGIQTSSSLPVTVNPLPTLTVTPSANPICIGQSSVLTASGATTYAWSANAGGGAGTTATVTPPVGTTVYTVTGTASGCSNTGTVSVTVNPLPTVTAASLPANICAGQTATLTAGGATTYTWSANAGSVNTTTVAVSPNPTDTYTVIGTDVNGCVNVAMVTVNVTPGPTLTVNANTSPVCAGHLDTLNVSGATTYTWSANAGSVNTSTASVNPGATTTYTVTGDIGGCTSTETVVVTVTPLPSLTVTAAPANLCSGGSTTLTATGATTFTWSANAGSVTTNTVSVSPGVTTTYTLSGSQTGCSDSTMITIVVGSQPVVTASATTNTICSSQSTTLTASGATTYTWSTGSSTNPLTVSPGVTTTYTVIGDNGGCTDTTTIVVTVNPTPTVTTVSSPTAICSGATSTLTASGATSYTWSSGGTTSTETVSPNTTTTYTVTGTSLNCTSTQTVTVNVTATPTLIVIAPSPTVCSGQSIPILAGGAATFTWSANAGSATTNTVIVSPITNPTTYTVTGANGLCTSTGTVSIGVVTTPTVILTSTSAAICAGQTTTLTASGAPNYTWSPGGATTSTISVSPAGTTTYTVTGDNAGCSGTQNIIVTVNPLPTVGAVGSQTVCAGNTITAINFTGGATVNWTNTNINIGIAASGTGNIPGYTAPNVATQQMGVVTAIPTNTVTSCVGASQTFTIVVNPAPTINGPAVVDSAKCGLPIGDVTGLTATGGTPTYTYTWYTGSTVIAGATNPNLTGVNIGTYSLVVTDSKGCKASSGPYAVQGSPGVIASFTANPSSGTAPLNVAFTNLSTGATINNWTFGNGTTSGGISPSTIYSSGGTYNVVLTASNASGCIGTATMTIIVDQAIVVTVPNVFSPNGDNINDDFFITTSGVTELNCEIFNRWGQKVYTIGGPTQKWDGKLDNGHTANDGTYYYMLKAKSYDGKSHDSNGYLQLLK